MSAVISERERIRENVVQAEARITALETELETAKQVRGPSGPWGGVYPVCRLPGCCSWMVC